MGALAGEVLDFTQKMRGKLPWEVWLHEAMFHCWMLHRTNIPFPSKDAAIKSAIDFMCRIIPLPVFEDIPGQEDVKDDEEESEEEEEENADDKGKAGEKDEKDAAD